MNSVIKLVPTVKGKSIDELQQERIKLKSIINDIIENVKMGNNVDDYFLENLPKFNQRYDYLTRIINSYHSTLFFTYEYFSDDRNPENEGNLIPSGTSITDAADIHKELTSKLDEVSKENITGRIAWSMPRGHAKSAYMSNAYPLRELVFSLRRYIIIISETQSMSRKFIEWIADQLKYNKKLREDFGELMNTPLTKDLTDNKDAFETLNGSMVQASSLGGQLRGSRYKSFRPDLCVVDDAESSRNTNTLELREKNEEWFNKVVMPIGDPNRTAFIYMGTLVHANGLLPSVLKRADFESKIFSAIVTEPDNPQLWEKFEEIYRNQDDERRLEAALDFYETNKIEMDKGTKTLWESRFPYYKLVMEKVNIGSRAFSSEFLNKPIDDENAVFKPSNFIYFDDKDLYDEFGRPLPLDLFGFWDIAIGKNVKSDYNAIITIGRDRRTGVIYILDAWAKKIPMHEALKVCEYKIAEYGHKIFGVETVQAQYDMFRQLRENLTKSGVYRTTIKAVNPRGKKESRIMTLEPLFENGTIRVKRSQRLLLEQLEHFLNHDNDDLPDALASCIDLCGGSKRRNYLQKPKGL